MGQAIYLKQDKFVKKRFNELLSILIRLGRSDALANDGYQWIWDTNQIKIEFELGEIEQQCLDKIYQDVYVFSFKEAQTARDTGNCFYVDEMEKLDKFHKWVNQIKCDFSSVVICLGALLFKRNRLDDIIAQKKLNKKKKQ